MDCFVSARLASRDANRQDALIGFDVWVGRCASYPLLWPGALCVLTAAWLKKNTYTYSQASQENSCCTHMFLESQQPSHSIHRLGYMIMPDSPQEIACRSYEGVMKPLICLPGGFKDFFFSSLPGGMIQFD